MLYDEMLATFRGDHTFEPEHLKTAYLLWLENVAGAPTSDDVVEKWVDEALQRIHDRRCPRCSGPLAGVSLVDEHIFRAEDERQVRDYIASRSDDLYGRAHLSASRTTECRCVPVCRLCENDEAIVGIALDWPVDRTEVIERLRNAYGNTVADREPTRATPHANGKTQPVS
jgi:hypothetical protein